MLLAVDSVNSISQFITLLLIFIFVLAVTYFSTKFIANYQKNTMANSNVTIIEAAKLAQNKYIEIVKIGDKYFALAVSKDNVSVICELDESELKAKDVNQNASFADVIKKFTDKNHAETLTSEEQDNEQN